MTDAINVEKCKAMHLGERNKSIKYEMGKTELTMVKEKKILE